MTVTDFIERQFAAPQQKFRRRRGRGWLVFVILVVVLFVLAAVADGVARSVIAGVIRDKIRTSLSIPASSKVDVTLGGVSVLWQLASGALSSVKIDADDVKFGSIAGHAQITASGLPIDQSKKVDNLAVSFSVSDAQLKNLVHSLSGFAVTSVATTNGAVTVASNVKLLGVSLPFGLSFTPGAHNGQLTLALKSVDFRSASIQPSAFRAALGSLVDPLLAPRSLCVASELPAGFRLDAVKATGTDLLFTVSGKNVALTRSALTTKGTCTS